MPSKKANPDNRSVSEIDPDALLAELTTIRKLLAILLTKLGSDSGEIGAALGIDPRRIRDWISFTTIKRISESTDKNGRKTRKEAQRSMKPEQESDNGAKPELEQLDTQ